MEEPVTQRVFDNTVKRIDKDITRFKDDVKEDFGKTLEAIESLRNRLPVWATFLFAILMGVIGWLV